MDTLAALENSGLGVWVRESGSVWSYPTIIFLHSFGLSFIVGLNAAVDLRLLGVARALPVAPMKKLFPIMYAGFWINAASGVLLLIADAATMMVSWIFWVKMAFIAAALVTLVLIKRRIIRDPGLGAGLVPLDIRILAAASLVFWTGAITAGRLTAYFGPAVALHGK